MYLAQKQMYSQHPSYTNGSSQNVKKMIENFSYGLHQQIGKGFSSKVYKGQNEVTGETVAIKVIDKALLKTPLHHALLQSEIEALSTLDSQYIMKLYKVFQTQNNTYLITEFCENGDLGSKLTKIGKFPEQQAQNVIFGLVKAYKLLKQNGIIHRDIKPANVLLSSCGTPKLADFGFATTPNSPPLLPNVNVGSPLYMSPQALKNNKYSDKSDIWAIGVSAFEIIFGQVPWQATSEKELAQKMVSVQLTFPSSTKVSQECKEFIKRCLVVNEQERASIDELEKHPWIRGPELAFQVNKQPALMKQKTLEQPKEGKENSAKKLPGDSIHRSGKKHTTQITKPLGQQQKQTETSSFEIKSNTSNIEYTIMSQINFCKYLFRVANLIENTNLFRTDLLRDKLLFFAIKNIMIKMYKLKDIDSNSLDIQGFDAYKTSNQFQSTQITIQQNFTKYQSYFKNIWSSLQQNKNELSIDKKFDAVFDENFTEFESFYIIFNSVLRQAIKELQKEIDKKLGSDDLSKSLPIDMEKDVVLLDYLVTYFQLSQLTLETFNKPYEFAQKSKIEHIAEGSPVRLTYGHFIEIKNKMSDLEV
ncbi:unnamed protein product [Paramecium primaurelia]|uniref:Protein kinase domain-containing protein n=1 Tax=Paramecium primaurelia TaxID=5886 RepID=A0A8S1JUW3_PARPR|nr:unnamed protein product [Paramecium primaurelia]